MPPEFWGEALEAAIYLYNRTPHSQLGFKTPFEAKYKIKPNISHIRIFGSKAYYKIRTYLKKLEPRAKIGVLIGYGQNQYKLLDPETYRVFWARDVIIEEGSFYFSNKNQTQNQIST